MVRRTTLVGPLQEAWWIRGILRRMRGEIGQLRLLGPDDFAPYIRHLTHLAPWFEPPRDLHFDFIVLRQDHLAALAPAFLARLRRQFACVAANRRFALFAPTATAGTRRSAAADAVHRRIDVLIEPVRRPGPPLVRWHDRAVLVTTYERPTALARSLPQLAAIGAPVVVIDDRSRGDAAVRIAALCAEHGATLMVLPQNRGLAAALNVGLAYLLADRRVEWISYFQDDVDVVPDVMERLRQVEDAEERPLLTGFDAEEHAPTGADEIAGERVLWKRSSTATHLHGHAAYWRRVLPIPSQYLGAPTRRWEASQVDYWIINHAPASEGRRGRMIGCLPGLVRTFLWHSADSTWDNPNQEDPPFHPPAAENV